MLKVEQDNAHPVPEEESTGNEALDRRLATGVLKGDTGTDTAQVWISAFLVVTFGFLVYLSSFSVPLHGEDLRLLRDSTAFHRLVTAPQAIELMPSSPLSALGLAVACVVTACRVDAVHGIALGLHLICAVLVFLIARRLLPKGTPEVVAMLAGLLFAAHPALVHAVSYLSAFPVLQSNLFGLWALLLLLRGADRRDFSAIGLGGAVLGFTLAFGSDSAALLYPVLGIALLRFQAARNEINPAFGRAALWVLPVTLAVLWIAGSAAGLLGSDLVHTSFVDRAASFLSVSGHVLSAAVWPFGHAILPEPGSAVLGGLLLILGVLGVALGFRGRSLPGQVASWVLLGAFSLACYGPAEWIETERYVYQPLAGLCMLLPWALLQVRPEGAYRIAGALAAVLVLVLGVLSFRQSSLWKDPDLLWTAEAERNPDNIEPLLVLGHYHWAKSRASAADPDLPAEQRRSLYTTAAAPWRRVLERQPGHPEAEKYLGLATFEMGELAEAGPLLERAAAHEPEDQQLALYLGYLNEQRARGEGGVEAMIAALRSFRRAAQLGDLPPEARVRYGMLAASVGEFETGLPLLKEAAGDATEGPIVDTLKHFESVATQIQTLGQRADTLLQERPDSIEGLAIRAERLLMEGRTVSAFYMLQLILDQAPAQDGLWALLGYASARMSSAEVFLKEWGESRAANPAAWEQLATRTAAGGLWDAAETYLRNGLTRTGASTLPEVKLAEIAMQLRQAPRAQTYLETAQQAYPDRPEPWLRLADIAIASGETVRASTLIEGAETRGATPEEVKALRDKMGAKPESATGIQRTVIR